MESQPKPARQPFAPITYTEAELMDRIDYAYCADSLKNAYTAIGASRDALPEETIIKCYRELKAKARSKGLEWVKYKKRYMAIVN